MRAASDVPLDLRTLQAAEMSAMIRGDSIADKWKVLIYDGRCAEIVAPTLRVGELRACNVTLWLRLEHDRQAVPDAPAVYFCRGTPENVKRIARDLQQGLYAEYHINFVGGVAENLLEELALASVESGRPVHSLWSRQLDFVALENDLFSLNIPDSYVMFNDEKIDEATAARFIDQMAGGLTAVVATLGRVPVIRCNPTSHVSRMVAESVSRRVASLLENGELSDSSTSRLLLVIDDRNTDLSAMVHHCPIYQSLVHECLGLKGNRVVMPSTEGELATTMYDLDSGHDAFWREQRGASWGLIGPAVKRYRESWQSESEAVLKLQVEGSESQQQMLAKAEGLTQAVGRMGKVTEDKKYLDMHTNMSKAISDQLANRGFVHLWKAECELLRGGNPDLAPLISSSAANSSDQLRLLVLAIAAGQRPAVPPQLASDSALLLVQARQGHKAVAEERDDSVVGRGWSSLVTGSSRVAALLSKYSQGDSELLKLSAVQSVLQANAASSDDDDPCRSYLYFDPKQGTSAPQRKTAAFEDSVLFVIGGGNYTEYHNVVAQAQTQGRRVVYGCSELVAPDAFLQQLRLLFKKKNGDKK